MLLKPSGDKIAIEKVHFGRIVQDEQGRLLTPLRGYTTPYNEITVQYLHFNDTGHASARELIDWGTLVTPVERCDIISKMTNALRESLKIRAAAGRDFHLAVEECDRIENLIKEAIASLEEGA